MPVESATYISDLNPATIGNSTDLSEGGAQVSMVKTVLKTTFPNVAGAVTATHTELNYLDLTTLGTAQASRAITANGSGQVNASAITWTDLGTVTTVDVNGGTFDGVTIAGASTVNSSVIGGTTPAAGTFTTLTANTSFVLNGSTALTAVDTDLSAVSAAHDSMTTAKAVKDYVDTEIAALYFATESYVDAKAKYVLHQTVIGAEASVANNYVVIPVAGTVVRVDVQSTNSGAVSYDAELLTSSQVSMATMSIPVGFSIGSDTTISNATVTAGQYLICRLPASAPTSDVAYFYITVQM